jgi:hypothetical protein
MLQILSGFPANVLAISVTGTLTAEEYRDVLAPALTAKIRAQGPLRLFVHVGPEFREMKAAAMWEDFKMGMRHWNDWREAAVVTDVTWIANCARLFAPFFRAPIRVFPIRDYAAAQDWIVSRSAQAA